MRSPLAWPLVCALLLWALAVTTGCGVIVTREMRVQEAVQDLNHHARFGRLAVAHDYVAPKALDEFMKRRVDWGSTVRVVDADVVAMGDLKKERVEVTVRISWFTVTDGDLKTTDLHQSWEENRRGTWELVAEEMAGGADGLLRETAAASEAAHAGGTTDGGGSAKAKRAGGAGGHEDGAPGPNSSDRPPQGPRPLPKSTHFPTIRLTGETP